MGTQLQDSWILIKIRYSTGCQWLFISDYTLVFIQGFPSSKSESSHCLEYSGSSRNLTARSDLFIRTTAEIRVFQTTRSLVPPRSTLTLCGGYTPDGALLLSKVTKKVHTLMWPDVTRYKPSSFKFNTRYTIWEPEWIPFWIRCVDSVFNLKTPDHWRRIKLVDQTQCINANYSGVCGTSIVLGRGIIYGQFWWDPMMLLVYTLTRSCWNGFAPIGMVDWKSPAETAKYACKETFCLLLALYCSSSLCADFSGIR